MDMSLLGVKFLKRKDSLFLPSYSEEVTTTLLQLQEVLRLPAQDRSESQLGTLVSFTRHLKFFSEIRDSIRVDAHYECCRLLTHERCLAGKVRSIQLVFHEGDEGSKFYIILSGSCGVLATTRTTQGKKKLQLLTILRQGDCFGELALLSNKPRAASVLCREDCDFAVLEREDYRSILGAIQDRLIQEKIELLHQHPVFSCWKRESVEKLSYFFKLRSVREHQALFLAGQPVNEVFLLRSGRFRLSRTESYFTGGKRPKPVRTVVEVAVVGYGTMLGGAQALEDNAFEYTCHCVSDYGEALLIPKANFKSALANEGKVSAMLLFDKEQRRKMEEVAASRPKETKTTVPPISEEAYQRLTAKQTVLGELPIIYQPKLGKSSSLPDLFPETEKRLLQMSMLAADTELGATELTQTPVIVTVKKQYMKVKQQPKRRLRDVFFYNTKPRFVSDANEGHRGVPFPSLSQSMTEP